MATCSELQMVGAFMDSRTAHKSWIHGLPSGSLQMLDQNAGKDNQAWHDVNPDVVTYAR
jgi:hypothetical protein